MYNKKGNRNVGLFRYAQQEGKTITSVSFGMNKKGNLNVCLSLSWYAQEEGKTLPLSRYVQKDGKTLNSISLGLNKKGKH